jgi:uncharacterized protein DUF6221
VDIAEFIAARLAEDEAAAKAAAPGPWEGSLYVGAPGVGIILQARHFEDGEHVVRHDPVRVLREVEAKQRIVNDYRRTARACRDVTGAEIDSRGYAAMTGARYALRAACTALAATWSGHPDFRDEWKP